MYDAILYTAVASISLCKPGTFSLISSKRNTFQLWNLPRGVRKIWGFLWYQNLKKVEKIRLGSFIGVKCSIPRSKVNRGQVKRSECVEQLSANSGTRAPLVARGGVLSGAQANLKKNFFFKYNIQAWFRSIGNVFKVSLQSELQRWVKKPFLKCSTVVNLWVWYF